MKDILEKAKKIISERSGVDESTINMSAFFMDDLNIDDMELSEIITELEETFDVELEVELEDVKTVGDLVHLLSEAVE